MELTQQEFAAELGVSFAAVNRWERGRNAPQPDRLVRIRELYAEHLKKERIQEVRALSARACRSWILKGTPRQSNWW